MILLTEYFVPNNLERFGEYLACLHENLGNDLIDKVYLFVSDDSPLNFTHHKLIVVKLDKRPTFKELFEYCNQNLEGEVCLIANGDIIFDQSLKVLQEANLDNLFVLLARWEYIKESTTPFESAASQDVWAFKSPIRVSEDLNFMLGQPGCDNRLAKVMYNLGYQLKNPSKQIVAIHLHASGYRRSKPTVPGPYLAVVPNEDITKSSEVIEIKGFDLQGNAIL